MELGLNNKIALVTGAGSQIGFGKAIAVSFAREGCDVVVTDVDIAGAEKTAAEIEALGRKALAIKADVSNGDEVNSMVKSGLAKFGKIDILVNNAGVTSGGPFHLQNEEKWHINVEINLKGTWYCIKAVLPQMLERKSGKIVNFSSNGARIGFPNGSLYAAAKAGVVGMTRSLAAEVGPSGINVNCISPGMGNTNFQVIAHTTEEQKERFKATVPLRRLATTQDIANMAVFLSSDAASYVTGQTFAVDGGDYRL
jgi:3-oxoacyl-[acyl-carrier protein] reductase